MQSGQGFFRRTDKTRTDKWNGTWERRRIREPASEISLLLVTAWMRQMTHQPTARLTLTHPSDWPQIKHQQQPLISFPFTLDWPASDFQNLPVYMFMLEGLPGQQTVPFSSFPSPSLSHKLINTRRTYGRKHGEVIICKSPRWIMGLHFAWDACHENCQDNVTRKCPTLWFGVHGDRRQRISIYASLSHAWWLFESYSWFSEKGKLFHQPLHFAVTYIVVWNKKCRVISRDNECEGKRDVFNNLTHCFDEKFFISTIRAV